MTAHAFLLLLAGALLEWLALSDVGRALLPDDRVAGTALVLRWSIPLVVFGYLGLRSSPGAWWRGAAAGLLAGASALIAAPIFVAFAGMLHTEMTRMERALWYQGMLLPELEHRLRFAGIVLSGGVVVAAMAARLAARRAGPIHSTPAWRVAGGVVLGLPVLTAALLLATPLLFPTHGALSGDRRPLLSLPGAPRQPDMEAAAHDLMRAQELYYHLNDYTYGTQAHRLEYGRTDAIPKITYADDSGWAGRIEDAADSTRWCVIVVGNVPASVARDLAGAEGGAGPVICQTATR